MTRRKEPRRPRIRRTWTRNPAQRAHSTPKGAKGYSRTRARGRLREEIRVTVGGTDRRPLRIVVLLSGEGTELRKILSQVAQGLVHGRIVAVIADDPDAPGIRVAREHEIETIIIGPADFGNAESLRKDVSAAIARLDADVVILDGFTIAIPSEGRKGRHVIDRAEQLLQIAGADLSGRASMRN